MSKSRWVVLGASEPTAKSKGGGKARVAPVQKSRRYTFHKVGPDGQPIPHKRHTGPRYFVVDAKRQAELERDMRGQVAKKRKLSGSTAQERLEGALTKDHPVSARPVMFEGQDGSTRLVSNGDVARLDLGGVENESRSYSEAFFGTQGNPYDDGGSGVSPLNGWGRNSRG